MPGSVIISSARTPIGKLSGAFTSFSAQDLGGVAIKAALERAGVGPEQVDYVVMGQVLQAGQGQITARQAAAKAGIPMTVPAITINKVCLSGLNAIYLADQMVQAGDAEVVVAGGMESMTNAPYLLPNARAGYRMGNGELVDSMINDGLWCAFDAVHMGSGTEQYVGQVGGLTREAQDELSAQSHERAAAAMKEGRFADEIAPVSVPQRKGDPMIVDTDEGVRPGTTTESLGGLRPAFSKDGTITAGNASQISDGGAAVVVTSREIAEELGATPIAELVSFGMVAGPDPSLLTQPSRAIKRALEGVDKSISDIDLFELNEAFAAVGLASMKDLGISDDIVNVNGGAIVLGHPIGMSGTRVVITLINELRRRGAELGAAALCGGGGQGDAAIVRVLRRDQPTRAAHMGRRGGSVFGAILVAVLGVGCSVETPFDGESASRASQIDRLQYDAVVLPTGVVQVSETVTFAGDDGGTIALGGSPLGAGLVQTPFTLPEITLPPGVDLPPGITLPSIPNLPGLPSLPGQSSVTNVAVDGAPVETTATPFGSQELRIDRRSAVVTFDVEGAVERFPDIAVLDLPVLPSPEGASRQDPDVAVGGTVRFSGEVTPELVEAHLFGGRDRKTAVDGGQLTFASRAPVWAPGNALYVGFPATLVPEATEFSNLYATQFRENARARLQASDQAEQTLDTVDETNRIGRLIFFIVAISLPALFLLRMVIHYVAIKISQRREVGDVPDELSQPPTEDDPAVVGVLWAEGMPDEPAVAGTMLALAHRRAISIEEYGERVVVRVPLVETGANSTEAYVLAGLRANASPEGAIEGPPVWRSFPEWRNYRKAAVVAAVTAGYASRAIRVVDISGLLLTAGIGFGLVSGVDLFVIIPVCTVAAAFLSFFFSVVAGYGLTKKGRRARALWKSFGEYIEHNAEFRDVGPAGVAIWGPYLVYGAVIGEAKAAAKPLTP